MQIVGTPTEQQLKTIDINLEAIDRVIGDWLTDEDVVVWEDEARMITGYVEKQVLAIDRERESVRLLRSWVPFGDWDQTTEEDNRVTAVLSVDLDKTFEQISCPPDEINEMSFPHGEDYQLDDPGSRFEEEFRRQVGGDIKMLWKADQIGRGAFLGRIARVGQEEAVFGGSIQGRGDDMRAKVDFEMPLSEISPARRSTHRR